MEEMEREALLEVLRRVTSSSEEGRGIYIHIRYLSSYLYERNQSLSSLYNVVLVEGR